MLVATYARCLDALKVLNLHSYLSVLLLTRRNYFRVCNWRSRAAKRVFDNTFEWIINWYFHSNFVALRLNLSVAIKYLIRYNVYLRLKILEALALHSIIFSCHVFAWYWVAHLVEPLKICLNRAKGSNTFIFKSKYCREIRLKESKCLRVTHLSFSLEAFSQIIIFLDRVNHLAGLTIDDLSLRSILIFHKRTRVSRSMLFEIYAALRVLAVHFLV